MSHFGDMISLSDITIPEPHPYDAQDPQKQRENLAYVALQILTAAKANGDIDPFGILANRPLINIELDDLGIKTFGEAAIIESY